ncbi:MAG: hypothetical protein R2788_02335 [Saprospiraceae bacterium]
MTDANGCTATCSTDVTVNDTENPVANCLIYCNRQQRHGAVQCGCHLHNPRPNGQLSVARSIIG